MSRRPHGGPDRSACRGHVRRRRSSDRRSTAGRHRRADLGDQTVAGALDHVEDHLEALIAAKVRIGNLEVAGLRPRSGSNSRNRWSLPARGRMRGQGPTSVRFWRSIARIRSKSSKCDGLEALGPALERDPAGAGGGRRPRVGWMANVPTTGPGTLDVHVAGEAGVAELVPQYALGGRGAADVAEADEEDPHRDLRQDGRFRVRASPPQARRRGRGQPSNRSRPALLIRR